MMIRDWIRSVVIGLCVIMSPGIWATASPVPMLEHTSAQIIADLKANQSQLKQNKQVVYRSIEQHLLPHVDLIGMSRSVLGRQAWMQASASEKTAFTRAFTGLVIRTYANPLAEYSGETVKFKPFSAAANTRFVRVNSVIVRPQGQTIPLTYSLIDKSGEWMIYDLSIEGVSLLQSFRSQFAQELQHANIQQLIGFMQKAH